MEKQDRIKYLVDLLNKYAFHYYTLDDPLIEDSEYDVLYDELVNLEKETGLVLPNSPTNRVGGEVLSGFEKHDHLSNLYSLGKAQSKEEVKNWANKTIEFVENYNKNHVNKLPKVEFYVELKFDGLTVNLTYDNGYLVMATTRGNGTTGEVITSQVRTINSIPLKINDTRLMEIQGEGLMPISSLEKYNKTHEPKLKNARNAAAGALRNLDPQVTRKRNLDAYFYNVNYLEENGIDNQEQMMKFLSDNYFKLYPYEKHATSFEEISNYIDEIFVLRNKIDVLTDGVVIKVNDFKTREKLGYTNKFPRWAIAYKFEPERFTTVVKEVEWNVGRTGKVTPTALLEPVEIGNVTVKRATLNNIDDIERKQVRLNSEVFIRRSNDVIPEIMGVVNPEQEDTEEIEIPHNCPYCHSELFRDGVHIFCPNSMSCTPQLVKRMVHFASRNAMNIDGLSEKTLEVLLEKLDITSIEQIYDVRKEQLLQLEGFKQKKSQNLIDAIEKSKDVELANFIFALGIPEIGEKTSFELSQKYKTFENLRQAKFDELIQIEDIGNVIADEIVEFFHDETISKSIDSLLSKGIKIKNPENVEKKLDNLTFVLTGSLVNYSRKELTDKLSKLGAKVSSSVSKNTDYVVYGEKAGSKLTKAKDLGVKLMTEDELNSFLDNL